MSSLKATAVVVEKEWDVSRLRSFVDELERDAGSSEYEKRYVEDLKASVDCLPRRTPSEHHQIPSYGTLKAHLQSCSEREQKFYSLLKRATIPNSSECPTFELLAQVEQWPRLSQKFFLQQLQRRQWRQLSTEWKARILEYAVTLTLCHRAERLLKASRYGGNEDIINELRNEGHTNWNPMDHPSRLLLEVATRG